MMHSNAKHLAAAAVAILLSASVAIAQSMPPTQITLFAGPTFDGHKASATLGASYPFSANSAGGLAADLGFRLHALPQTNIRGFWEQRVGAIAGAPVLLTADVGAAFAASDPSAAIQQTGTLVQSVLSNVGTNIGYLAATGVRTEIALGKNWYVRPGARIAKGSINGTGVVIEVTFATKAAISKEP